MAHLIECDHAGCGRTGFDCDGSWYRLTVTDLEHTTVWYCSPYCLMIDTLRFDGAGLSHQHVAQLRAALTNTVQAIPQISIEPRPRPRPHSSPRVPAFA